MMTTEKRTMGKASWTVVRVECKACGWVLGVFPDRATARTEAAKAGWHKVPGERDVVKCNSCHCCKR